MPPLGISWSVVFAFTSYPPWGVKGHNSHPPVSGLSSEYLVKKYAHGGWLTEGFSRGCSSFLSCGEALGDPHHCVRLTPSARAVPATLPGPGPRSPRLRARRGTGLASRCRAIGPAPAEGIRPAGGIPSERRVLGVRPTCWNGTLCAGLPFAEFRLRYDPARFRSQEAVGSRGRMAAPQGG